MSVSLPNYEDVVFAIQALKGVAHRTPVLTSRSLNARLEAQVFFKCENLQRGGAFKFRGAYYALSKLTEAQRKAGVVAFSSGNHAQAVAFSARLLGIKATIVMPHDAPSAKKAATLGYGAHVVEYDRYSQNREHIAQELVQQHGLSLIPPFNHPDIIAGQGTAAKELFDEVGELDQLYVPVGGGGLLSGSLLSAQVLSPDCAVYGVEPEQGNDAQQSLQAGEIIQIPTPMSIADGALTTSLGTLTFPLIQRYVSDVFTVTDQQLIQAMSFFAERMKLIVEPTACLGTAALFQKKVPVQGKRVGVIISGGNVDLPVYADLLRAVSDVDLV